MKRRMITLTLALLYAFSLTACGTSESQPSSTQSPISTAAPTEETTGFEDLEDLGEMEVDQNLFTVEITVPAEFIDKGTTQESLDTQVSASGYVSATLNDDGSVTYVMTKAAHNEMMNGIRETIQQSLSEMVGSDEFPSFTNVEANDDFTQFTIETTSTELGLVESFSVLGFYMLGGMYHAFNGTQVDDIAVTFINADTGETVGEAHSSDMA